MTFQMKIDEEREDAAIEATIEAFSECNVPEDEIVKRIMVKYKLAEQEALDYMAEYKGYAQLV